MTKMILTTLMLMMTTVIYGQAAVPATLNQIQHDPAQTGFEKEYDDLQETIGDLDKPSEKQSEEERESKLPSHEVKSDYKKR